MQKNQPEFRVQDIFYQRTLPNGKNTQERVKIETQLLLLAAEKRGIAWRVIPDSDIIELKKGDTIKYMQDGVLENVAYAGVKTCANKQTTKQLLAAQNISVAKGFLISKKDSHVAQVTEEIFHALQKPLVMKLSCGSHGDGVVVGINDLETAQATAGQLLARSTKDEEGVLVEECFSGKEYRIVVAREKVLGIMHRIPANVTGDGQHTVAELIEEKNKDPFRNIEHWLYPHISLDDEMRRVLSDQGLTEHSVPSIDQYVSLRRVSNIMAGGDAVDYTDIAHQSVKEIALQVIAALPGLPYVGIDFLTKDITKQQTADSYCIVEVNSMPEFAMHDLPMIGECRHLADHFISQVFPE